MFTNFDVDLSVGYPSKNEIYFHSCFKNDWIAGVPTEINQLNEETEWDFYYSVSDNTKSLVKSMLFLLCSAFGKLELWISGFFNCVGHRNDKDFQRKITE